MIVPDLERTLRALAELNAWEKCSAYNFAIVPKLADEPFFATVDARTDGNVLGRIRLFPGFSVFRDFQLFRAMPDYGVATCVFDFPHWEIMGLANGAAEAMVFETGRIPRPPEGDERRLFALVAHECCGMFLRLDDEPELPLRFARGEKSSRPVMFSRCEGLDGKWRDAPLPMPDESRIVHAEKVTLSVESCQRARALPLRKGMEWELDFRALPMLRNAAPRPQYPYAFVVADGATHASAAAERLTVSDGLEGLKSLWESLSGRLLALFLEKGEVPESVSVRSDRVARFLRPLGMQVPFKLVRHGKLPAVDALLASLVSSAGSAEAPGISVP